MDQSAKTTAELSKLAASRQTPAYTAATGQPLTHYHSFFSELLSWNNPRTCLGTTDKQTTKPSALRSDTGSQLTRLLLTGASAIAYATIVSFIFVVRYLDVLRWAFKLTWMVLGITVAAEVAGKALLNNGFATQLRPRKYYTLQRETLDALIGDVHELINFFIIESQRILFAENVYVSGAVGLHTLFFSLVQAPGAIASDMDDVCEAAEANSPNHQAALAAFISYFLAKIVPYWGLAVIATTVIFFAPLVYSTNKEFIDNQLKHAGEIVGAQTAQLRSVAQKHTEQATHVTRQYVGDYTAKAQALLKNARGNAHEKHQPQQEQEHKEAPAPEPAPAPAPAPELKPDDFPVPPKEDIKTAPVPAPATEPADKPEQEPLIAS